LIGREFESKFSSDQSFFDAADVRTSNFTSNSSSKLSATSFYLNPSLVMRVPTESKFVPYAKLGLYIGLVNTLKGKTVNSNSNSSLNTFDGSTSSSSSAGTGTSDGKGNINLGFTATLGADYMLTDNLAIFGELNLIAAAFSLKTSESSSTSTGSSNGSTITSTSESKYSVEYVDEYTTDNKAPTVVNTPISGADINSGSTTVNTYADGRKQTSTSIFYTNGNSKFTTESTGNKQGTVSRPLSSLGLSVGIKYYFGK
jgi:hypothetical protein